MCLAVACCLTESQNSRAPLWAPPTLRVPVLGVPTRRRRYGQADGRADPQLAVRKMELMAARWEEFDLDNAVWYLPAERTKTGVAVDIPLPPPAVEWLRELKRLAGNSAWVLPARKMQNRMIPHVCDSTLSVALSKVKHGLPPFTVHDFRRTARTHLSALGVDPHIAERCLNHKIKGVEGIYDRHSYFAERKEALTKLAAFIVACETGNNWNVVPLRQAKRTAS